MGRSFAEGEYAPHVVKNHPKSNWARVFQRASFGKGGSAIGSVRCARDAERQGPRRVVMSLNQFGAGMTIAHAKIVNYLPLVSIT
jgi:hypothetical protein